MELVALGVVPLLVALLHSSEGADASAFAIDALRNLARMPEARDAIRNAGGIPLLAQYVKASSAGVSTRCGRPLSPALIGAYSLSPVARFCQPDANSCWGGSQSGQQLQGQ